AGWHISCRLNRDGQVIPYAAQNGGGYTLEALLGVKPNANSTPDFLGWEIKAYSSGKVTLMTPEPDAGYYGKHGVREFVRKYGYDAGDDVLYFTGVHRANMLCSKSGQTLRLRGFDHVKKKITEVDGGIELVDSQGNISASWTFQGLIAHWSRKHSAAAFVPYDKKPEKPPEYHYKSPILLGEETEFPLYLTALHDGLVIYDPGSKVTDASSSTGRVKARSQFRISVGQLQVLYKKFGAFEL
ncbi:MAG: MvaI/BcnI family restriction endonuclease, partial [Burkholderiales bacterium]